MSAVERREGRSQPAAGRPGRPASQPGQDQAPGARRAAPRFLPDPGPAPRADSVLRPLLPPSGDL